MDENTREIDLEEIQKAIKEGENSYYVEEYEDKDSLIEKLSVFFTGFFILCVVAALLYGGFTVYKMFHTERSFNIADTPSFEGKPYEEVTDFFSDPKYKNVVLNKKMEYRADLEENIVISQRYERRDLKDNMYFTVSGGYNPDETILLPNFKIMTREEIESFLEEKHLTKYEFKDIVFHDIEQGKLVSFTPEKESIKRSEKITFIFSKKTSKEGNIFLPSFMTMEKDAIDAWCAANNFQVEYSEEASEDIEKGKVISQDPLPDSEVEPGSTIKIVLSKGDVVLFGSVDEKKFETVKESFEIEGFQYSVITKYDYKTPKNIVIGSEPTGNLELERGTTITLFVSGGKPNLSNLVGRTRNEAQEQIYEIKSNGALLNESFIEEYSNTEDGIVLSVSNEGDINKNESVVIKVSKGPQIYAQNFSGKQKSEIEDYALKNSILLSSSYSYSNLPENHVISNSPNKGEIDKGDTMKVVYSLGTFIPSSYVGNRLIDVENEIEQHKRNGADITVLKEYESSDVIEEGYIVSQQFDSGILRLTVSSGKDVSYYTVEDLVGISVEAAKNTQTCRIFNCVFERKNDSNGDIITSQNLFGEHQVGETIILTY